MSFYRGIESVVDVLRNITDLGIKCNLLVGAGCSVSAGIPTATDILGLIKEKYPSVYRLSPEKDYATCMKMLAPNERKSLISNLVASSQLNMTYIAIAELIHQGFVHRILTPNFDNLLIRACSLVNEFPPIYDLASYEDFKPQYVPDKGIFYLHGQYTGMKLMNTAEEVDNQAQKLKPLFERLHEKSVWLVVGYSGLNDALFNLLTSVSEFENRLFWVGYKEDIPHESLQKKLLSEEKYAFYVNGYDSDAFFWELSNRLGTFPPHFMKKPFTYLKQVIDDVAPYTPDSAGSLGIIPPSQATSNVIQKAIDDIEDQIDIMATYYYNLGLFEEIINWEAELIEKGKETLVANAYFAQAWKLIRGSQDFDSAEVAYTAIDYYHQSITLRKQLEGRAFYNIGICWRKIWERTGDSNALINSCEYYITSLINLVDLRERPLRSYISTISTLSENVFKVSKKLVAEGNDMVDAISHTDLELEAVQNWHLRLKQVVQKQKSDYQAKILKVMTQFDEEIHRRITDTAAATNETS